MIDPSTVEGVPHTRQEWDAEVAEAAALALTDFTHDERALLEDIPVHAANLPSFEHGDQGDVDQTPAILWGSYRWVGDEPVIEVYWAVVEYFPDPVERRVQLRDIMRHEYNHALGRNLQESAFKQDVGLDPWRAGDRMTVKAGDLIVTLPEVD